MARKHRIHFPNAFYHVINRGNQRRTIFRSKKDYTYFIDSIAIVRERYPFRVHAFCLMPNHFHMLAEVEDVPLQIIMRSLLTRYARYFNQTYRKVGHVFQGRYRAILCQKDSYLLELVRYIHLNPVRAGIVGRPEDWAWSSHAVYLGESPNPFVSVQDTRKYFGRDFVRRFREFISEGTVTARKSEKKYYPAESFPVLGDETFTSGIEHEPEPRRRLPQNARRMTLEELAESLCARNRITVRELTARNRPHAISQLRAKLVYAAIRFCEIPPAQISSFLKLSPSAVTRCYRRFHRAVVDGKSKESEVLDILN